MHGACRRRQADASAFERHLEGVSSSRRRRHVRQPPNAERSSAGNHAGNDLFRDYPEQASVT
jgi:hypothetical protein